MYGEITGNKVEYSRDEKTSCFSSQPSFLTGSSCLVPAQDLLVLAFLAEAIDEIDSEEIAEDILGRLEGWLSRHRSA